MARNRFQLVKSYSTSCDNCGTWSNEMSGTLAEVTQMLEARSWRRVHGKTLCPVCAEGGYGGRFMTGLGDDDD